MLFLQRLSGFMLCLVALFAIGCGQGSDDTVAASPDNVVDPSPFIGVVVINDMDMALDHWGSDDYEIETGDGQAPVMEDDTLTLMVSYGGGCEDHDVTLVASDEFLASDPVQLDVALAHDANGDLCEAYLTDTYDFDLTPIKDLYREAYQEDSGTIVLLLEDAAGNVSELDYTFGS